jgi:hypothetical protein
MRVETNVGDETAITIKFHKPIETWTADDRTVILRRLAAYMRDHSRRKPRRRSKVAK